jgi:oligoribonuclease (3'-5' exoribonuclease)
MLRGFEEMSLMADNNIKSGSSFIVEVLPELRARIINYHLLIISSIYCQQQLKFKNKPNVYCIPFPKFL